MDRSSRPSYRYLESKLTSWLEGAAQPVPPSRVHSGTWSARKFRSMRLLKAIAITGIIALPLWAGVSAALRASFRDHLDVFNAMMLAPVSLIFPLVVVLLTCLGIYNELVVRYVANTRSRIAVRAYVGRQLLMSAGSAAIIFFLYAFIPFVVSFYVWPILGDPGVDPAGYNMSPAQAMIDSFGRTSYSFLLENGSLLYGVVYSAWIALAAAAYAVLGVSFLLTVPNRILALGLPFMLYLAGTVAAALLNVPQVGLLYSVFPAGLQASDPAQGATPTLILFAAAAAFAVAIVVRAPTNPRLA